MTVIFRKLLGLGKFDILFQTNPSETSCGLPDREKNVRIAVVHLITGKSYVNLVGRDDNAFYKLKLLLGKTLKCV